MKNILFPTDFSNDAYNALHYATLLFASEKCTFYILNIYNENVALRSQRFLKEGGKVLIRQLAEESQEDLLKTVHRINRDTDNAKHIFKTVSKKGEMLEGILSSIHTLDIDLVAMGNKGKMGTKEMFLGGNTVRAIKKIEKCPVLMVPRETEFVPPKKIAFATHFMKDFERDVLDPLRYIAEMHEGTIHTVHVDEREELDEEQQTNRSRLIKELKGIPFETHWRPRYTEKSKVINDFVEDLNINLLIMINYEHSLLEKIIREPVISEITTHLNIPFLVIPSED
ncbi:universal stress protein [Flagellimonas allohymeniacidonis]|uniref:Universal stress protein n=1 Tax=Flagellimonas allohymeniacidonis TaxID=2517819 RepID=A0A4Q8QGX2_9FLAO|nr:universal stress protein [Allomuricauda hymeniacidonis]TAI49751.1 universal stress protein [Allomuricauda hymeniacidonis]